jgi:hypothetical protein
MWRAAERSTVVVSRSAGGDPASSVERAHVAATGKPRDSSTGQVAPCQQHHSTEQQEQHGIAPEQSGTCNEG